MLFRSREEGRWKQENVFAAFYTVSLTQMTCIGLDFRTCLIGYKINGEHMVG